MLTGAALIDRLLGLMRLRLSASTVDEIVRYANGASVWERNNAVLLLMLAPEMHLA